MSSGGNFKLHVAAKGKRLSVTTNEGSSYEGIVEQVSDCALHGATVLLRDGTMYYLFRFCDIKEMEYEVVFNEDIDSRDTGAVEEKLEDPVENIGTKLVPALGNPIDNARL